MRCCCCCCCSVHTGSTNTHEHIHIYLCLCRSFALRLHMSMCFSSQIYVCIDNNFSSYMSPTIGIVQRVATHSSLHTLHCTCVQKQSRVENEEKIKKRERERHSEGINDTNIIAYWKSETHKNWCGCGQTKTINSIQLTSVGLIRRSVVAPFTRIATFISHSREINSLLHRITSNCI